MGFQIAEDGKVSKESAAALAEPARKERRRKLAHSRAWTALHVTHLHVTHHHQLQQLYHQHQQRVVYHLLYQSERPSP